ncbi:hypothetical protein [Roseinatronobacter bogoriensis]|nr:hypothetical protein [Rhodobaca]MBB4209732.1 hypothetical protein [Rhodobaca bogoriensis DSM 18756]
MTDLVQRMRHLIEVDYIATPEPKLKDECLEIYQAEIAAGTEMPARRAADLIHAVFTQICGKITRDITGTGISQRSQFV